MSDVTVTDRNTSVARAPITQHAHPSPDTESPETLSRSEPVMVFPVVGKGAKEWPLMLSYVEELRKDFPTIDVMAELRKAHAWLVANPGRRKTAGGMPRTLVSWMSRTTDRRGGDDRRQDVRDGSADRRLSPVDWTPADCPHTPKHGHYRPCLQQRDLDAMKRKTG